LFATGETGPYHGATPRHPDAVGRGLSGAKAGRLSYAGPRPFLPGYLRRKPPGTARPQPVRASAAG